MSMTKTHKKGNIGTISEQLMWKSAKRVSAQSVIIETLQLAKIQESK